MNRKSVFLVLTLPTTWMSIYYSFAIKSNPIFYRPQSNTLLIILLISKSH